MKEAIAGEAACEAIQRRFGEALYRRRVDLQVQHTAQFIGQGRTWFHWENLTILRVLLSTLLHAVHLYERGKRNACALACREHEIVNVRIPAAFSGFRILHLSDLHLDLDEDIVTAIVEKVRGVECDIVVLTGDYRAAFAGDFQRVTREMARVLGAISQPVYAVLGNHDSIEMAPAFEALGLRMLLNENVVLEREGELLYLAGIDDPHYYDTDDLDAALAGIPEGGFRILLAHSAEVYREAESRKVDVMFCGHTHGGQICFPGGLHLLHSARHPRRFDRGAWQYRGLQGYTSAGTGCCAVPVRFYCPPEITMHTLRRG